MRIYFPNENNTPQLELIGGKAYHLAVMKNFSLLIPKWFCLTSEFFENFTSFTDTTKNEILKLLKDGKKYAVRSSAIDEDNENASFAGIHETYLNVSKTDVIEKIALCYKSFFSTRALEYRKMNDLSLTSIKVAVIIQEMVESEYAGVINTINPVTSNPDEFVISIVKGLGESLVSGDVNSTDFYVNNKKITKDGDIVIPKKALNRIIKMAKVVSLNTDHFQDIEFAIKGGKVYFLQTRDITPYAKYNTKANKTILDNSNIVESYSGVTTNLTYSFAREIYQKVYTETLLLGDVSQKLIDELMPSLTNMLAFYDNKIYYNLNSWYHLVSIFPFKRVNSYMENMMGVSVSVANTKKLHLNLFEILHIVKVFFRKLKSIDDDSNLFIKKFDEVVMPKVGFDFKGYTLKEIKNYYETLEKEILDDFTTPIINDCAAMLYMGILKKKIKDEVTLASIVSNQGDVESALSAKIIIRIIEKIRSNENIKNDFLNLGCEELKTKYEVENTIIKDDITEYLKKFGARVMDELKLETITLLEDSTYLFQLLKSFIMSDESLKALTNNSNEQKSSNKIKSRKIKKLVSKTKYFIRNRERLRLKRTYIFSVVRKMFIQIGVIFKEKALLDDERDIFYLEKKEIFDYIENGYDIGFKDLASKRKVLYNLNGQKEVYSRIVFYGKEELKIERNNLSVKNNVLKGIPSGAGVVKGEVKLVTNPKEASVEDKIILAYRTDPGWIVLFPLCKGLIVEKGSILSHSAVVAREMGIPAVVNVPGAVKIIKDGSEVKLDGIKGEIHIYE